MNPDCVYEDEYFKIISPNRPLNSRSDGGHLILIKKDKVADRADMSAEEAIDFVRISMAVGKAMYDVLGIERMNYEDLGNWGIDDPGGAKMHLHFFGRAENQIHQIRAHHMFLYPKDHPIYQGHLDTFTPDDLDKLRTRIAGILTEDKYVNMAQLAGIE